MMEILQMKMTAKDDAAIVIKPKLVFYSNRTHCYK